MQTNKLIAISMIRRIFINSSLVLLSTFIALGIAEGLLRLFLPTEKKRIIYDQSREVFQYNKEHIQFDSRLGYITKPHLTSSFTNREFSTTILTNSLGFRDDEASCQDPDVLILGDSFGFGWGVEKEEGLEAILEKESGLSILNMSVSGYNNVQELALLEKWQQNHSLRNKTIILLYYVNDMLGNLEQSGIYPSIEKQQNSIVLHSVSVDAYHQWTKDAHMNMASVLAKNFYSIYYLRSAYALLRNGFKKQTTEITPKARQGDETRVFRMVLEKFSAICQKNNCNMLIAYIPYSPYLKNERYTTEYFFLKYLVASYHFDLVDLSSRMGYKDYYLLDEHWNTDGHTKAAMILKGYLLKKYE